MSSDTFYIYFLKSKSGKYYIGYSSNPWKRVSEHNTVPYNTFTSKHRPWDLVAVFFIGRSESEAIKIERLIKKQKTKAFIEKLIDPAFVPTGIFAIFFRVPHVRD